MSVAEDNEPIVLMLLEGGYVDINSRDTLGRSALHYSAANGNVGLCQLLLRAGAEINGLNKARETPLMKACQYLETHVIEFLFGCPTIDVAARDLVRRGLKQTGTSALDYLKKMGQMSEHSCQKKMKIAGLIKTLEARQEGNKVSQIISLS